MKTKPKNQARTRTFILIQGMFWVEIFSSKSKQKTHHYTKLLCCGLTHDQYHVQFLSSVIPVYGGGWNYLLLKCPNIPPPFGTVETSSYKSTFFKFSLTFPLHVLFGRPLFLFTKKKRGLFKCVKIKSRAASITCFKTTFSASTFSYLNWNIA